MVPNLFELPFKWALLLLIGTVCQAFLPMIEDQFDIQTNAIDTTTSVTVRGVIGGRVLLPCDVTAPNPSDSAILVLFYTESKKTPIYSLDSRGLSLYSAQHWSDPDLQGRVNLQVDYGNQGLLLQKVRSEDEGLYRCRVDFKASPTRNSKIHLDVIEPPRHLLITSKWRDERVVSKVAGPFPEGAELTLSCQVMGGDPPPQVTWWHEGALLDDITETRTNQMTRNSLQLPPLTRTDLLKKLTCQAVNSNLTTPLSATVEVDLAFPPTSVKLKYSNEETHSRPTGTPQVLIVSEGEPNPLKCEVEGSRPQAVVSWTINGKPISDKFQVITNPSMYSGFPETAVLKSTLMLIPEARDKDSEITCQAVNPQLPDEHFLYDHAILNVLYKPRIKLTEGKKINLDDVKEGNDIYFECEVDANPPAQKIVWAQNGKELTRNPSKGVLLSSSGTSLILQDVTRAFSGTYTCTAVNEKGSTTSNNLTMNVKFIPACSSMNGSTIGGGLEEAVKARCKVDSHPPATHFRWAFNSTRGLQDISDYPHVILNDSSSVLEYNIKSTDDFGAFLCWASNALGNMKEPCIINVIPAAKPESVSGCEIFNNGSIPGGRVLIQCVRGWDGGLAQSFTLEVRKAAHYKTKVLSALQHSKEPAFYISDLQAGEKYLFTVTATNSRGESVPVTLFHTVPGEVIAGLTHARTDPQKSLQRYMPMIAVALGITMTIFISIVILVCVVRFRNKKKNVQLKKSAAADSLTEGDSSMQSIVGHCIKEKDNINNCNSLSCYDDCSTYNSTLKSQESILYHTDLRTLPMNQHYMHQRENQSLLTAPGDHGNTYIGTEELTVPECQHFLPLDGNSGELSNSLGRASTLSSGSTAPSTFRDSQTTIVYNPKYSFDERKAREELNTNSWIGGVRDDVQL